MTCKVPRFHVSVATTGPKTGDLRRALARSAGVDIMILPEMFGDLLVLDGNVHPAVAPVTWVHSDLGVMLAQDIPVNQDGIHPVMLLEHIIDHGNLE